MPNSKKIVFVIHGLPMGGAEKFLITLSNHLYQRFFSPNIILLSNDDQLISELDPLIPVYRVLKKRRYDLTVSKRISQLIDTIDPHVVMCINTYSFFLTRLGQLFKHKQKIILSPHSTIPFSRYNYFQNLIYFRVLHPTDYILYLCEAQKTFLKNIYGLSKHHSNVVYNGIDTSYFNPELLNEITEKKLRSAYGILDNDKVIIQVARLQKEKCHADAILALAHLNQEREKAGVHLIIVGSGNSDYLSNLESIVKKEMLGKYVHFVGNQSDVRPFLKIADLFTLTSESETFSIAALEAMSFGLPVVITDVGGAKEMVVSGLNGTLVKPHNILELAKAWRNTLDMNLDSREIRDHVVKKFSIQHMVDRYVDLLFTNSNPVSNRAYAYS
jgi:glycosyltransferase involved in cell wall biosynthesis